MKTFIKVTLLCFSFCISNGQQTWLSPEFSINKISYKDLAQNEIIDESAEIKYLNYNPIFKIDKPLELALNQNLVSRNIFTVYISEKNSSEKHIWSIEDDSNEQIILTDRRIANINTGKFMNFVDDLPGDPQINNYFYYLNKLQSNKLQIGDNQTKLDLPIESFTGFLGDIIVFDQRLAPSAQSIIETTLAIKYSIPLSKGVDYSTEQEIIWNGIDNIDFGNRIAGLLRNDECHIYQKQSKSKLGDGYFSIGNEAIYESNKLNNSILQENDFLLWGDNDDLLSFQDNISGTKTLARNWLINNSSIEKQVAIEIHSELINSSVQNKLWLLIENDLSEKEFYRLNKTEYYSLGNIPITTKKQHISLIDAPEIWAYLTTNNASCNEEVDGSMEFIPVGINKNFTFSIVGENFSNSILVESDYSNKIAIEGLQQGAYTLILKTDNNVLWENKFQINSANIPDPELQKLYIIDKKESINASINMPLGVNYQWTTPKNKVINSPVIKLNKSGVYLLELELDGCYSKHTVNVISSANNIEEMALSPNPSANGYFNLKAKLHNASPYIIKIHNSIGELIQYQEFPSKRYIEFNSRINYSGIFYVSLYSGESKMTKKLVIQL